MKHKQGRQAEPVLIKNGRIKTMTGKEFSGSILIEGTKIVALGEHLEAPPEARVIEAAGCWVLPGFIDSHCHVGIGEEIYREEGDDLNEVSDPLTPEARALDGINPEDKGFQDARLGGVTTVFSSPGSGNVIGGTGVVLKTAGKVVDKMLLREPAGLKVAFGENPKFVYGEQKKMPMTRMGIASLLRQALADAQTYKEKMVLGESDPEQKPERDLGLEVLNLVLARKIPLRAHAHRTDDIMTAIRIAREFKTDLVIEHCTEGHKIAEELAEYGYPVIVGPSLINRAKVELKEKTFQTAGILAKAGLKVALMTDHSVTPIEHLPLCAALAVKDGMSEEDALKAITINAAEILGVADRVGSLEVGKDADIVIWSEHPLALMARPRYVLIDGAIINS
jgi:imidazolonepropionase-like amidohydrolase